MLEKKHANRQQLLAEIDAAASAAAAEARRKAEPLAKAGPELPEYLARKAADAARSKKRHELTHNTGSFVSDYLNEELLDREVRVDDPLPRPSNDWLLAVLGPPLVLALIVAFIPPVVATALRSTRGRALIAAAILWPLMVLAWGFIFEWETYFQKEQYIGLLVLPPVLATLGVWLWHWARNARA